MDVLHGLGFCILDILRRSRTGLVVMIHGLQFTVGQRKFCYEEGAKKEWDIDDNTNYVLKRYAVCFAHLCRHSAPLSLRHLQDNLLSSADPFCVPIEQDCVVRLGGSFQDAVSKIN